MSAHRRNKIVGIGSICPRAELKYSIATPPASPRTPTQRIKQTHFTVIAWFGHVTRHDSLSNNILQGTLDSGRRRGRQRKCWIDNVNEWTSSLMAEQLTTASCRTDWKTISAESSGMSPDDSIGQRTGLN